VAEHLDERPLPTVDLAATRTGGEVLALPVGRAPGDDGPVAGPGTAEALADAGLVLDDVCADHRFTGSAGAVLSFPVARPQGTGPRRLVLVGTGDGSRTALRRAGAGLARALAGVEEADVALAAGLGADEVGALVEGLLLGAYVAPRTGTATRPGPVGTLRLVGARVDAATAEAVQHAVDDARATWLARDLAVTPSSEKTPAWMARTAEALAAQVPGLEVEVLGAGRLAAEGFGGLLAVGGGSAAPPALVRVTWQPADAVDDAHVVLVGKGITFDTGGLSIKPREGMLSMKTDMSGSAVVLATVLAAARTGVPRRVTALLALAENAVGAGAYRPGDVVTVYGGTTVEIANTDAEGRIVLADALAYADAHLDPAVLVDVATLTGAASLGLGRRHAALYSDHDDLVAELEAAAEVSGERVWRMPLVEDYAVEVESDLADLRHVTADRTRFNGGGSISAALFLRELVGGRRWAHLDVAGPARADKDEHEVCKGATGYGARLLLQWLRAL
jgi:leucyl aminopeptidase